MIRCYIGQALNKLVTKISRLCIYRMRLYSSKPSYIFPPQTYQLSSLMIMSKFNFIKVKSVFKCHWPWLGQNYRIRGAVTFRYPNLGGIPVLIFRFSVVLVKKYPHVGLPYEENGTSVLWAMPRPTLGRLRRGCDDDA